MTVHRPTGKRSRQWVEAALEARRNPKYKDPEFVRRADALLKQGMSDTRVATELHTSNATVKRIKQVLAAKLVVDPATGTLPPPDALPKLPTLSESEVSQAGLAEYRKVLRRELPVKQRAAMLAKLATDENPSIAIKALELIDRLDGISQRVDDDAKAPMPGPMFILPPGSDVSVDPPGPRPDLDALVTAGPLSAAPSPAAPDTPAPGAS